MRKFKLILSALLLVLSFNLGALEIDLGDVIGEIETKPSPSERKERPYSGTNFLAPVNEEELAEDDEVDSVIHIKSNVSNAEVYLNGVYKGKTSVTLKNLRPGKYRLELRKRFYECDEFTVNVREGFSLTYEIYMKEIQGTIRFQNIPSDAKVYLDESRTISSSVDIIAGYHNVKIKRFGFEEIEKTFFLEPYHTVSINPEFKECPFELRDFKSSREEINPEYSGAVGKSKITFYVTAKETATLSVFAPDGTMTNTYVFPEFMDWEQSYSWNGCSDDGTMLGDGLYWIELDCAGKIYRVSVTINTNLNYPMMNNTSSGFGYGKAPALEPVSMSYGLLGVAANPLFLDNRYETTRIDAFLSGAIGKHFSMGGHFNSYLVSGDFPFVFGCDFRYADSFVVTSDMNFNFGVLLRYGYAENVPETACDTGAGLGGGVLVGCSTNSFSATAGFQYIASPETGIFMEEYNRFQASVALAAKLTKKLVFFGYGMINTNAALAAGCGVNVMPFGGAVVLNAGFDTNTLLNSSQFDAAGKFGITFVF